MTTGLPKPPTIRSIITGIALFVITLLAFLRISDIVKYTGAALMFIPSSLGLVDMVAPAEVLPFSLAENPSFVVFPAPGQYAVYTDNYDLLVVHDAVVNGNSDPWIKILSSESGAMIDITLISRGLSWYDTPFARGRQVVSFFIKQPGRYQVIHPTRPDNGYIVPDVVTGNEFKITTILLIELGLLGGAAFAIINRRTRPLRLRRKQVQELARARAEVLKKKIQEQSEQKKARDVYEPSNYWKKQ